MSTLEHRILLPLLLLVFYAFDAFDTIWCTRHNSVELTFRSARADKVSTTQHTYDVRACAVDVKRAEAAEVPEARNET